MRRLICFQSLWQLAAIWGVICLPSCERGESNPRRSPVEDSVRDVSLGDLPQGTELRHVFQIRNTTDRSATIVAIKKECGCHAVGVVKGAVIPAGAKLKVPFSAPARSAGSHASQIIIETDSKDPDLAEIVLTLRANIKSQLWATPSTIVFSAQSEAKAQELRIDSTVAGLLDRFSRAESLTGKVAISAAERANGALFFRLSRSDQITEEPYDLVRLHFDDEVHPLLHVRVKIHERRLVAAYPRTIVVPAIEGDDVHRFQLHLISSVKEAFAIRSIASPGNIVVNAYPSEPKRSFSLSVEVKPPPSSGDQVLVFDTEPLGKVAVQVRHSAQTLEGAMQ